ncbi:MAG TPA: hypothetical protein PKN04_08435 [bacterium]|jgi:hypothetical protein|nr:hypothetical protein [bacterium]HNT65788.1 hypothetical protein [bacterium]
MNLISDYREQQESDHEDEREDPFAEPEYEEKPTISPNAGAGGLPEFPQHRRRSRSPWWLILALLLLISAAIYWGFLRDQNDLSSLFTKEPSPVQIEESDDVKPKAGQTTTTPAEELVVPGAVGVGSETTLEPTAVIPGALGRTAQLMSWFSEALPKDMRLTTLIMDETSFSAEISAADRQALDAFYQRLQDRFPGKVTFSPTTGTSGTRTLLSGLYDSPVAPVSASASTAQGILANLQSHASTTGVQIIDSGADSPRQRADQKTVTPLFVKVRGTNNGCLNFIRRIAQENGAVRVSKVILLSNTDQQSDLVLRLEVNGAL